MAHHVSSTMVSIGYALLAACLIWTLGLTFIAWRREREEHRNKDD